MPFARKPGAVQKAINRTTTANGCARRGRGLTLVANCGRWRIGGAFVQKSRLSGNDESAVYANTNFPFRSTRILSVAQRSARTAVAAIWARHEDSRRPPGL